MEPEVVKLFKTLLSFKSITPDDGGAFHYLKEYLKGSGDIVEFEKEGVKNLLVIKEQGKGDHLTLAGHIDVVPPGKGWETDPFVPVEKEGYIYGRGAQDMKSGLAGLIYAFKYGKWKRGTLSLMITSDEEGDAKYGTIEILRLMERENILPNYGIVAEPTCENQFGDTIKIGRRGSINGVLRIKGVQGHAAYPERCINPVELIAPLMGAFVGRNLDNGDEHFAPSKLVITDIRGGMEVTNVTPDEVKIMFNVRNGLSTNREDIEEFFRQLLRNIPYELHLHQSAYPFKTSKFSKVVKHLKKEVEKETGVTPTLSTSGGTSDARFLAQYGVEVAEFGVINDRAHKINERTTREEVIKIGKIFKDVVENWE
jgi:succinyl-diaminopimelate desuccinylase